MISYRVHEPPFTQEQVNAYLEVAKLVFNGLDEGDFRWRFDKLPGFSCCDARAQDELVGFKLGYAHTTKRYYSWLGGVVNSHRKMGIARELMLLQHEWLSKQGYTIVETCTQETNAAMANLNEQCGFHAVGSRLKPRGREIIYQKKLLAL